MTVCPRLGWPEWKVLAGRAGPNRHHGFAVEGPVSGCYASTPQGNSRRFDVSRRLAGIGLILCFLAVAGCGGGTSPRGDGDTENPPSAVAAGKEGLHTSRAAPPGQRMSAGRMSSMAGVRDSQTSSQQ